MAKKASEKLCARDLRRRPLSDFRENPNSPDGRDDYCSGCRADLRGVWGLPAETNTTKRRRQTAAER